MSSPRPVRVLGFELSTRHRHAAIVDVASGDLIEVRGEAEQLARDDDDGVISLLRAVLANAELDLGDVDIIAAGLGPGSTGLEQLQHALAVLQGVALSHHKPLAIVSSLEALAQGAADVLPVDEQDTLSVLAARAASKPTQWCIVAAVASSPGQAWTGVYAVEAGGVARRIAPDAQRAVGDAVALCPAKRQIAVVGDVADAIPRGALLLEDAPRYPRAVDVAVVAALRAPHGFADVVQTQLPVDAAGKGVQP